VTSQVSEQIPLLFERKWHQHYVRSKLKRDPLFPAVIEELRGSTLPLLDIGCGLGLLALQLKASGFSQPMHGVDYDAPKIDAAQHAAHKAQLHGITFATHDARKGLPEHSGDVCILDILQFFTPEEQRTLLEHAVQRVAPNGKLIIRSTLRDDSKRFRWTVWGDRLAKITFWMKAAPVYYPTQETFKQALGPHGKLEIRPLYEGTPFNNYLIVLQVAK
jgi:2-polyprenyl-3-methyl-5-hydroxy-6-metoxy-1,4-benzoquinol methylase